MQTNGKRKKFDCLKMKANVQRKVWARLKGMTPEQELAYWQERHRKLEEEQRAVKSKLAHASSK